MSEAEGATRWFPGRGTWVKVTFVCCVLLGLAGLVTFAVTLHWGFLLNAATGLLCGIAFLAQGRLRYGVAPHGLVRFSAVPGRHRIIPWTDIQGVEEFGTHRGRSLQVQLRQGGELTLPGHPGALEELRGGMGVEVPDDRH